MSQALTFIGQCGLLTANDIKRLEELIPDIEQSFATAQVFRTETEMHVSVLNDTKHPTPDSKYWQAVREQDVHAIELVELSYEYRLKQVGIRRLQKRLDVETDEIERDGLVIEIERQTHHLYLIERQAHHRVREVEAWARIKDDLRPHLEYGDKEVNDHQLKAMRIRWRNEAQLVNEHTSVADARNILGLVQATTKK